MTALLYSKTENKMNVDEIPKVTCRLLTGGEHLYSRRLGMLTAASAMI